MNSLTFAMMNSHEYTPKRVWLFQPSCSWVPQLYNMPSNINNMPFLTILLYSGIEA